MVYVHESWYRGPNASFNPRKSQFEEPDAIKKYVLSGWLPKKPFIDKNLPIISFGSCFANNVSGFLKKQDYNILDSEFTLATGVIRYYEGMVNTYLLHQHLEWGLKDKTTYDVCSTCAALPSCTRKCDQLRALDLIREAKVLIITLGLTEVWYNLQTEEYMWKAVPQKIYDPKIHSFKITTFQENYDNLCKIYSLIRTALPEAHIIFTLSPIPLKATFRPISCITANTVSKATLRTALDQMLLDIDDDKLYYFPSYELVKEFFINSYRDDNTHVKRKLLNEIMLTFKRFYCID